MVSSVGPRVLALAILGVVLTVGPGSGQVTQPDSCSDIMLASIEILLPCAESGEALAQSLLGLKYDVGLVVPKDVTEAVRWSTFAARARFLDSQP
jgi:TPR repeat protein